MERLALTFDYTNHRGETARRTIIPSGVIQFKTLPPWYPEFTWLLRGYDITKQDYRDFQISKMLNITEHKR